MSMHCKEYRELFLGNAKWFLSHDYLQRIPCWLNEVDTDNYLFWHCVQFKPAELIRSLLEMRNLPSLNGQKLYEHLVNLDPSRMDDVPRACRHFILNQITFRGEFSSLAFNNKFTERNILNIENLSHLFGENVFLSNFKDPVHLFKETTKDTFIRVSMPDLTWTYILDYLEFTPAKWELDSPYDPAIAQRFAWAKPWELDGRIYIKDFHS